MARSLEIDMSAFVKALEQAPEIVGEAAKRGLHDALDEWKRESTDLAPLSKGGGTLRRGISTEVNGAGLDLSGEITAVAVEVAERGKWAGRRFNYAYYIHEVHPNKFGKTFKRPSTSGTIPEFLDKPADDNGEKWVRDIESEIKDELKRKGW
ncbi:HK97 gp10 family phage protein [Paenibacillus naphthalenovorans]|uniref:HK97 gp10 family phage protein n=1 Tax=Paenibacillus naphthalenovorans TaxID=162209 RepID=UPI003D2C909C